MGDVTSLEQFRKERQANGDPSRKMWVCPNDNYPGEWMVGVYYNDEVFVAIASFYTRLEAMDFAVWEAANLGGMQVYAFNFRGFEKVGPAA